jgi:hypothetical protein
MHTHARPRIVSHPIRHINISNGLRSREKRNNNDPRSFIHLLEGLKTKERPNFHSKLDSNSIDLSMMIANGCGNQTVAHLNKSNIE